MRFFVRQFPFPKFQRDWSGFHTQMLKYASIFPARLFRTRSLRQDNDPCLRPARPPDEFLEDRRFFIVHRAADCHESCHSASCQ